MRGIVAFAHRFRTHRAQELANEVTALLANGTVRPWLTASYESRVASRSPSLTGDCAPSPGASSATPFGNSTITVDP